MKFSSFLYLLLFFLFLKENNSHNTRRTHGNSKKDFSITKNANPKHCYHYSTTTFHFLFTKNIEIIFFKRDKSQELHKRER